MEAEEASGKKLLPRFIREIASPEQLLFALKYCRAVLLHTIYVPDTVGK